MRIHESHTLSAGCYAAGYLTGLAAFWWMARKRRLATAGVAWLLLAGLFGGLIFANLIQFLVSGSAGKTVLGGIAGSYLTVVCCKRWLGIQRPLGDLFAVALCAGEAVGRWGCFFGGCCYGKPTHLAFGVWQHGAYRHPTQLYLSLASLVILCILLWFARSSPPENGLFYLQGTLYCAGRFAIEFYRETPQMFLSLSLAQWACLFGFGFFAGKLRLLAQRQEKFHAVALS